MQHGTTMVYTIFISFKGDIIIFEWYGPYGMIPSESYNENPIFCWAWQFEQLEQSNLWPRKHKDSIIRRTTTNVLFW